MELIYSASVDSTVKIRNSQVSNNCADVRTQHFTSFVVPQQVTKKFLSHDAQ